MFFYASFLQPPPRFPQASSSVSITPQIANDLRTSYFEETSDVFFTWSPSPRDFAFPSVASTARKLTTWRESSMYKSLSIPLPSTSKANQEWRLGLSTGPNANFVVDLAANPFGTSPLPVISMPVQLEATRRKIRVAAKQEQIERLYAIPGPETESTILCIREQTSFDLDKKIWDSGLGLSSWLTKLLLSNSTENPLFSALRTGLTARKSNGGLRVLELGSGTGIVSICLSALLEKVQNAQSTQVLATDLPSALESLENNIASNKSAYPTLSLEAATLDWDEETLPPHAQGPIDFIIMADVTYNTASFPALVRTIGKLIESSKTSVVGIPRTPVVLLAYKQRDSAERELWPSLSNIGVQLRHVDDVKGAGAEAVEIWLWIGEPGENSDITALS